MKIQFKNKLLVLAQSIKLIVTIVKKWQFKYNLHILLEFIKKIIVLSYIYIDIVIVLLNIEWKCYLEFYVFLIYIFIVKRMLN